MPRLMSFSITTPQMYSKTKDVTRRNGWLMLKKGDRLWAVEKAMGLKKGERVTRIGLIEVVSVSREPLSAINQDECTREGFSHFTPDQFCDMFIQSHKGVDRDSVITRIEFKHLY